MLHKSTFHLHRNDVSEWLNGIRQEIYFCGKFFEIIKCTGNNENSNFFWMFLNFTKAHNSSICIHKWTNSFSTHKWRKTKTAHQVQSSFSSAASLSNWLKDDRQRFLQQWVKSSFEHFITTQTHVGSKNGWIISQKYWNFEVLFFDLSGNLRNLWRHLTASFTLECP